MEMLIQQRMDKFYHISKKNAYDAIRIQRRWKLKALKFYYQRVMQNQIKNRRQDYYRVNSTPISDNREKIDCSQLESTRSVVWVGFQKDSCHINPCISCTKPDGNVS